MHAYERMNRVYNYTLDPCGPVYITVGDGGNIEKVEVDYADEPGKCPSPKDNIPEFGGVCHLNFTSGPAKGNFCWNKQPEWSAFRESSFGHGILEVFLCDYYITALLCFHEPFFMSGFVMSSSKKTTLHDNAGYKLYVCLMDLASKSRCLWRNCCWGSDIHCAAA